MRIFSSRAVLRHLSFAFLYPCAQVVWACFQVAISTAILVTAIVTFVLIPFGQKHGAPGTALLACVDLVLPQSHG